MYVILMIITVLAVLLLVWVLVRYLRTIIQTLVRIGGSGHSLLAKLRLGLRAIERETGYLPTHVGSLNETLSDTADGLKAINTNLEDTIEAVSKQNTGS